MNHIEFSNSDKLDENLSSAIGNPNRFNLSIKQKIDKAKADAEAKAKAEARLKAEAEMRAKDEARKTENKTQESTTTAPETTTTTSNPEATTTSTPEIQERLPNPKSDKILGMPKSVAIGLGVLILGVGGFLLYRKFKK